MSPRTPEQNAEIRKGSKQKIMDAAFGLIARNGFEATSIAAIAAEAGVSKGLLYNYFSSKEELLKELVNSLIEMGNEFEEVMNFKDPKDGLKLMFEWFFKELRERLDHWRLLTELTLKIEKFEFVRDIVTAKMNEFINELEKMLRKLNYEDPLGEARLIGALFDGIGIQALIAREAYHLDELEQFLMNRYCK